MDRIGRLILDVMQRDARTVIADIAAHVGAAAVQRRLRRLREAGTIAAEVTLVDPEQAGFGVTASITVELERDSAHRTDAFKRRALAEPQVQQ